MEQDSLKDYIGIFDDVIPLNLLSRILSYHSQLPDSNFVQARVIAGETNILSEKRKANQLHFNRHNKSLTNVYFYHHLKNIILSTFWNKYHKAFPYSAIDMVKEILLLKYENNGKYDYHVDHCCNAPRTISTTLLLNNDYEGGELCFYLNNQEYKIDNRPGRLIMWPSFFLYPHTVKPVTKGTRYSIVSWLL